jgi:hypothetical protein
MKGHTYFALWVWHAILCSAFGAACTDSVFLLNMTLARGALHQESSNSEQVSARDFASVHDFDSTPKVKGITGSIEIIRVGTNGRLLHVSDMIELRNDASSQLTQAKGRTLEVYLPPEAKIDSVIAAGPERTATWISALPVAGKPGYFTVNFPLRPGATRFSFNYDLPYQGQAVFRTRRMYPVQQFAVMIPATMKFKRRSGTFQVLPTGDKVYQVEVAMQVDAGEGPEFEISGSLPGGSAGESRMKPQTVTSVWASSGGATAPTAGKSTATGGSGPKQSYVSWPRLSIVVAAGLVLCIFVLFLCRRQPNVGDAIIPRESTPTSASAMEALRQELFQLELDWLQGTISKEEYDSAKQALQGSVKRALEQFAA